MGTEFSFPEPTFCNPDDFSVEGGIFTPPPLPAYRTAWDAIGDLPTHPEEDTAMRGRWAALLPSIPEGQNYLWHTDRGGGMPLFGWRRRFWNFLLKLSKDRPAWTIQAQPGPSTGPFHWNNRRLTIRELCRLQTFPDDVSIFGPRVEAHKQVGNAVPSLLAEVLGRRIRTHLLGSSSLRVPLRLLPPNRLPAPPPEAVAKVPASFLRMIGHQTAHPGTGKGYGARARQRGAALLAS